MLPQPNLEDFLWNIADLLRGPYRPPQYERVMLPLIVLRRFDCVLANTKSAVLERLEKMSDANRQSPEYLESVLCRVAGQRFYNTSKLDFQKLKADPNQIAVNLENYIDSFSKNVRDIFEYFEFRKEINVLDEANRLYQVISRFADIDLSPAAVPPEEMATIFENLIRRFNEAANETAGDHFTPRDVVDLLTDLLISPDGKLLSEPGVLKKVYDPTCGTGGLLARTRKRIKAFNPAANIFLFGQDYNRRAYAIAKSDLLIKMEGLGDRDESDIQYGNTLKEGGTGMKGADGFPDLQADYVLANPPYGVDWKSEQKEVEREHERASPDDDNPFARSRFPFGTPRVNDGSLLFLQVMLSKTYPNEPEKEHHGTRVGVVFNGSPLFSGGAGSGESEIRRQIIERDWLETIVALPEQMFYNTGIGTYIWIVTNRKEARRKGKIQLIDARDEWKAMRRSLGDKRRELTEGGIKKIIEQYGDFASAPTSKIFDGEDFGYHRLTVERPLRLRFQMTEARMLAFGERFSHLFRSVDRLAERFANDEHDDWNLIWKTCQSELKSLLPAWTTVEKKTFRDIFTVAHADASPVVKNAKDPHPFEADANLRDFENVPLSEDVAAWFAREVTPHVPDAWIDESKTKIGYEINLNRHFYQPKISEPLEVIDGLLKESENRILALLSEVTH